ncbi:MAG: hypothetical protein HZA35_04050 [Parcubacteria group bacterium]|nr:hypothetical protein [Parcubacteria group bacterium]
MNLFLQIVGWLGTTLIVLGYFFVSSNKMKGTSATYQLLNLCGAIFLGIDMARHQTWSGVTLQIIWGAIALLSLFRHREK